MLRHNWLSIAGLGAFVCEHKAAYFDAINNIWYPPCRRVRFIYGIFPEDNILLKSVIRKYNVSVKEGRSLINEFVGNTLAKIQVYGKCEHPGLGVFIKSDSGNILFKRFESPERIYSKLGYHPVDISQITHISEIEKEEKYVKNDINHTSNITEKFNFEKNYYLPINKLFIKSAACILLFIAVALSFVVPTNVAPQIKLAAQEKQSTEISYEVEDSSDSMSSPVPKAIEEAPLNNMDNIRTPSEHYRYHLIVGTFRNEEEARRYMTMQEGGDYDLTLLPTKTLYRVACASSNHFEELQKELNSSKFKTNYKEAWIWISNPDLSK